MPAKEWLEIAVGSSASFLRGSPGREAGSCGGPGSHLPPTRGLPGGLANLFPRGRGGSDGENVLCIGAELQVPSISTDSSEPGSSARAPPPSIPAPGAAAGGVAGGGPEEAREPQSRPLPASASASDSTSNPGPEDAAFHSPSPPCEGAAGCSPERLEGSATGSGR